MRGTELCNILNTHLMFNSNLAIKGHKAHKQCYQVPVYVVYRTILLPRCYAHILYNLQFIT